ncbi:putative O-antigen transporter [compost metagenome]
MSKRTRTLALNSSALLAIQLANYILPFLLIPYLTKTLGTSLYGIVAFGLSIIQISCIITDYGFGLSATYKVAKHSEDKSFLRKLFGAVTICKAALLLPAALLIASVILFQDKYTEHHKFFWLLLLPVIGQTFQPIWFFQGIERMGFITISTVLSRSLYLATVLILVSSPADYYLVAIANGFASISAAVVGIIIILRLGYWPEWCGWNFIIQTFKESTEFFWSRAAVSTYTAGGPSSLA